MRDFLNLLNFFHEEKVGKLCILFSPLALLPRFFFRRCFAFVLSLYIM